MKYGRHLEDKITILSGRIRTARVDSVTNAKLYQLDLQARDQELAWLMDQMPRWYERPALLITVTALVTIWATLRAVSISIR